MTIVATLCFIIRGGEVLLIRKKKGFGIGKYNGVGGKVEEGESLEEAARREVVEEVGVEPLDLEYRGVLKFYSSRDEPDWIVHVFVCRRFRGTPRPSDEAEPAWFPLDRLPLDEMWDDDRVWLAHVLNGGRVDGTFWYDESYSRLVKWDVKLDGRRVVGSA